jgi:hypothetical protein
MYPSLEDIRSKYQELAKAFAVSTSATYTVKGKYSGTFPTRAYKTGRLYKSINVLLTSKEANRVVMDLAAVRYSIFLNSGFEHWKSGKVIRRPFAVAAAEDKVLAQMVGDYQKGVLQEVALEQLELVGKKLSLFGVAK